MKSNRTRKIPGKTVARLGVTVSSDDKRQEDVFRKQFPAPVFKFRLLTDWLACEQLEAFQEFGELSRAASTAQQVAHQFFNSS